MPFYEKRSYQVSGPDLDGQGIGPIWIGGKQILFPTGSGFETLVICRALKRFRGLKGF
jgi:hypothetical protein